MRFLLALIFWAVALYVIIPPIVRFVREWRSLHFAMSRTVKLQDFVPGKESRVSWLESLKRMNPSDRNGELANAIGAVLAFAIMGIGYLIAGTPGMVIACALFAAIVFWRVR